MYEFSYTENPPNCVGGIRELFYCILIASLLLALLLNTSRSLLLLRINCLVSTVPYYCNLKGIPCQNRWRRERQQTPGY
jgi:hypothetical protein